MILFRTTFIVILCTFVKSELPHPLSDEFINMINAKKTTWTAGRNFHEDTSLDYIKKLMGVLKNSSHAKLPVKQHPADVNLPESFDPRDKWPNCPSLNEIRDQGACGSCWAFGAVEAMTDRVCTYSNGTKQFHFSAQDLTSCCKQCGSGCHGGDPNSAWEYWKTDGLVSGGAYNSNQGCRPYEIPPCEHHAQGNLKPCQDTLPTPECRQTCQNNYNVEFQKDKHYSKEVYSVEEDEDQIKAELYQHGPVEGGFAVYGDFLSYKKGVYQHTQGNKLLGHHAIKILGWGVEDGTKYWLCANSWNPDWGNKGFFKILRGSNHCNIESSIVAGEPLF